MKCSRSGCNSTDFVIKDNKLVCEYCNTTKYINKERALKLLHEEVKELKNEMYSGWSELGDRLEYYLKKVLNDN